MQISDLISEKLHNLLVTNRELQKSNYNLSDIQKDVIFIKKLGKGKLTDGIQ